MKRTGDQKHQIQQQQSTREILTDATQLDLMFVSCVQTRTTIVVTWDVTRIYNLNTTEYNHHENTIKPLPLPHNVSVKEWPRCAQLTIVTHNTYL